MRHLRSSLLFGCVLSVLAARHARADNYTPTGSVVKVANGTTAANYTHTEGPMFDGNGGILFGELSSTHNNGLIYRYDINGVTPNAATIVSNSGGMQGGNLLDATHFVTADRDTRRISIRDLSNPNTITSSISAISGSATQLNGPNDLIVDASGGIYFTDPNFENFSGGPGFDAVYYIAPGATTAKRVITLTNDRPNGLALSPDGKTLYVAFWQDNQVYKFAVNTPGTPTNAALFANNIGSPDGMTIDPWGNLIVARAGGITCFSPAGATLFNYTTNSQVTNVELGPAAGGAPALYFTTYNSPSMGLFRLSLIAPVPEPASVGVLGIAAFGMLMRRRR